jgi:gliding motility-associated lipoprotein GldD
MKYMQMHLKYVLILAAIFFVACKKDFTPKPTAYFRISFPEKTYQTIEIADQFSFEMAQYANIARDSGALSEPNWYNISIPANKASIHLSYKKINGNLEKLSEESRELVYKHTIKASAINEHIIIDPEKKVYGTLFEIKGNAASPLQFHLTDSTQHFLRGSLYIREVPNYDSLKPVIEFMSADVYRFIETLNWN